LVAPGLLLGLCCATLVVANADAAIAVARRILFTRIVSFLSVAADGEAAGRRSNVTPVRAFWPHKEVFEIFRMLFDVRQTVGALEKN
jgi:hypothetical protein